MGCLEDVAGGRRISLGQEFLIGRAPSCSLVLDDPCVSSQHALLRWRRGRWSVRDLGSRNGTTLDDHELVAGRAVDLSPGNVLGLGGAGQRWRLIDEGPPVVAARQLESDRLLRGERGFLGIPDGEQPEITLYRDEAGRWVAEQGGEVRLVGDQEALQVGGDAWQLWLPQHGEMVDSTRALGPPPRLLRLMTARFWVSRDEEHIELVLGDEQGTIPLGARSHHHMLLLLARARAADREDPAVGAGDEGWLYADELCKMLGCDNGHLNIQVFRARKQLTAAGVDNGGEIVERRPGNRSLRLGVTRVVFESV